MTKEVVSVDTADHASGAIDVLEQVLKPASAVYLTEGTHVHTGNHEHGIGSILRWRGVKVEQFDAKKKAWPSLDVRVARSLVNVEHHVATTAKAYLEAGAFSTTMGDLRIRRARAGWEIPKLLIRAHRHQFGVFDDGYGCMVVLPPWQGMTRFTNRVVPGIVPQCGMVIADWRMCPDNSVPVIHKRIHTAEQPPAR